MILTKISPSRKYSKQKKKIIDLSYPNALDSRFVQPFQMLLHFKLLLRYAGPCVGWRDEPPQP